MKIKYSEIKFKTKEQLIEMRNQLKLALTNRKMYLSRRDKGISPKEAKKNIARINQRLNELAQTSH